MSSLFVVRAGAEDASAPPLVLLHGFGGSHRTFDEVVAALGRARPILLYDLPGHGRSLGFPGTGHAVTAARAIAADLAGRAPQGFHLVGHSMGGAAAALVALKAPEAARSLTLLAPGGFGPEINYRLLERYAAATEAEELRMLMEQFFGWRIPVPQTMIARIAEERRVPGQREALMEIGATLSQDGRQKMLPIAAIGDLARPVKVVWGTQDRVLPTRQAHKLPGRIAVHVFEEIGHMLPHEEPAGMAGLILENAR
ncbi:alpha/beta fold hydrolase [Afifella sp. IM 167]|uniref:alpha/beta fold hydrolase n=1 Tax=Afifella sp. IM 167 TaxID=2033586 RepID=UPI001CCDC3CB|nr:alpha/beta fold hydrolase [Afifella sp. IM 167]